MTIIFYDGSTAGVCKEEQTMKTAGYESCYAAIMGAKLEQPHTYPAFTEYFDVEALDSIRAAYGVDLYNECLKDATAAIEPKRPRGRPPEIASRR